MYRTNYVEIDLEAVRHNARQMLARLSNGTRLMAVVKADAYGHGAVQVARAALEALDRAMIGKNLSPGGCADLLAIVYFSYFLSQSGDHAAEAPAFV